MTVKELKEKLNEFPNHMEIFIDERTTDFKFGMLQTCKKESITFSEDPDYITDLHSQDEVVVLSEDF